MARQVIHVQMHYLQYEPEKSRTVDRLTCAHCDVCGNLSPTPCATESAESSISRGWLRIWSNNLCDT
jgi:TPP-dependent indolepyruvate ferredoxin oxidoreductase alpha subunit